MQKGTIYPPGMTAFQKAKAGHRSVVRRTIIKQKAALEIERLVRVLRPPHRY